MQVPGLNLLTPEIAFNADYADIVKTRRDITPTKLISSKFNPFEHETDELYVVKAHLDLGILPWDFYTDGWGNPSPSAWGSATSSSAALYYCANFESLALPSSLTTILVESSKSLYPEGYFNSSLQGIRYRHKRVYLLQPTVILDNESLRPLQALVENFMTPEELDYSERMFVYWYTWNDVPEAARLFLANHHILQIPFKTGFPLPQEILDQIINSGELISKILDNLDDSLNPSSEITELPLPIFRYFIHCMKMIYHEATRGNMQRPPLVEAVKDQYYRIDLIELIQRKIRDLLLDPYQQISLTIHNNYFD